MLGPGYCVPCIALFENNHRFLSNVMIELNFQFVKISLVPLQRMNKKEQIPKAG